MGLKVIHCFSKIQMDLDALYFYVLNLAMLCLRELPGLASTRTHLPLTQPEDDHGSPGCLTESSENSEEGVIHSAYVS